MAKVTFDGDNRLILVNNGITSLDVKIDLYSDWKEWIVIGDNSKYLQAMSVIGGEPTVGGQFIGSTFFLLNGWKIRSWEGNHTLAVNGNLYCDDGSVPFLPVLGAYTVTYLSTVSNLIDTISTGGSGSVASDVWNALSADYTTGGTKGKELREVAQLLKAVLAKL